MNASTTKGILLLTLAGCSLDSKSDWDTGGASAEAGSGSEDLSGGDADGETGDGETPPNEPAFTENVGPCSDGTWGTIGDPASTVHFWGGDVSSASEEGTTATGEMNAPFTNWAEFETARTTDPNLVVTAIGLWKGEHSIPGTAITDLATENIPIFGCGAAEVKISLSSGTTGPGDAMIQVESGMNVALSGLTLEAEMGTSVVSVNDGGTASLHDMHLVGSLGAANLSVSGSGSLSVTESVVLGGATSIWTSGGLTSLTVSDVDIAGAQGAGIWTSGGLTSLIDVRISNIYATPGLVSDSGGWGLVVSGSDMVVHNVTVDGAVRAGIVAAVDGVGSFKDITVSNVTAGSDGSWGRGIHVEGIDGGGTAYLENINIDNVQEAGMFIQNLSKSYMENVSISNVTAVEMADTEETKGGDGLVLVQMVETAETIDPSVVYTELTGDNSFTAIARAGIIAHASHLRLSMPDEMDAGYTGDFGSIFSQSDGVVVFMPTEPSSGGDEGGGGDEDGDADDYGAFAGADECDLGLDGSGFDFGSPPAD